MTLRVCAHVCVLVCVVCIVWLELCIETERPHGTRHDFLGIVCEFIAVLEHGTKVM